MMRHPFIFSNKRKYLIQRHATFWIFWWLFQSFLYTFVPFVGELTFWQRLPSSSIDSFLYLGSHFFLSYTLMYFVIPRYIVKSKYMMAAIWTVGLIVITATIAALTTMYAVMPVKEMILPEQLLIRPLPLKAQTNGIFYMALIAGLRGGLTVGGMAAAIKLMKHWYVQGQKNLELQKENVESQLQLLKAQVHPHFLFNTLNNIYAHTQKTSPEASSMVMSLSEMLRYMLYECNQPLVPLPKELKMIGEYIELEKIRYGNHLELHLNLPQNSREFSIAPLLLLPFVENCFKHGISQMLENPWLNVDVSIDGDQLSVKLINSKPPGKRQDQKMGIGIQNVKRRLQLLYPAKHELTIKDEDDLFIVHLKLHLEKELAVRPVNQMYFEEIEMNEYVH